jgi:hypothetical protein
MAQMSAMFALFPCAIRTPPANASYNPGTIGAPACTHAIASTDQTADDCARATFGLAQTPASSKRDKTVRFMGRPPARVDSGGGAEDQHPQKFQPRPLIE